MTLIADKFNQLFRRLGSCRHDVNEEYSSIPSLKQSTGLVSDDNSESSGPTFTPDDAISHIGFGVFHVKLTLVLGLVAMVEGMEIFVMSVLAPYLRCYWGLTYMEETLLPLFTSLGMMVSSPIWGWLCDVYGRKKGLYISGFWFLYFAVISTFSPDYKWLVILRFLVGFGMGSVPQVTTILAEYTPAKSRGKVLTFSALFWSIGFIFAASLSLWLMVDYGFRALLAALCAPGILFLWSFYWMPESSRFYATNGQSAKALETLQHIAKVNSSTLPPGKLKVTNGAKKRKSMMDVLRYGYLRMTVTIWVIWFIGVMMYYSSVYITTEIFNSYSDNICHKNEAAKICVMCKVLKKKDYVDVIWTSFGEFPGVILSMFLVDWLGRKRTMYVLAFVAIGCQSLLFVCLNRTNATILLMVIRCVVIGFSNVVFLYAAEAYPTRIRAMGMGSGFLFSRTGMLTAPLVAQALFHRSFNATKYFFVSVLAIAFLSSLSLPFDTKKKTLV